MEVTNRSIAVFLHPALFFLSSLLFPHSLPCSSSSSAAAAAATASCTYSIVCDSFIHPSHARACSIGILSREEPVVKWGKEIQARRTS